MFAVRARVAVDKHRMGGRLGGIDSTRKGSRQGGEDAHGRFGETPKAVVHPSTALVVVFALRGCWGQCVIGAAAAPRRTPRAIGSLATVGVAAWRQLEVLHSTAPVPGT